MIYYQHAIFGTVFVTTEDHPIWKWTFPDHTPTRVRNIHLYCRQAPEQGHPECECGIEAVAYEAFTSFLEEIPFAQAYRLDPQLVDFVGRIVAYPLLSTVVAQVPRKSALYLLVRDWSQEETLFEIYRVSGEGERSFISLNPLLDPFLPWKARNGRRLFSVPCRDLCLASEMLVLALERCLWGVNAPPSFTYAFGSTLDDYEALEA